MVVIFYKHSIKVLTSLTSFYFFVGSVVATYSENNWYRAQVIDVDEKKYESANVFFLDYGGCKKIDQCDMRPMHDSLISLSFQAIECSLANIAPSKFTHIL